MADDDMTLWPQENLDFAWQDRDAAWQELAEMFEVCKQDVATHGKPAPGAVAAFNLDKAYRAWHEADTNYWQMIDSNRRNGG